MLNATNALRLRGSFDPVHRQSASVVHHGGKDQQGQEFRLPAGIKVIARQQEQKVLRLVMAAKSPVGIGNKIAKK